MEEIVIVVGIKKNYIKYMEVMLTSLLINNKDYKINFNVLQDDFTIEMKESFNKKFKKYSNLEINYLDISSSLFSEFPTLGHLVIATYYRILTPEILTKFNKVLYLDVDLIIDGDILKLWNTNIEDYTVAAVREESVEANENRLGIPKNQKYFNAGVLLMNLKKIREEKFFERIMKYLKQNQETILYSDQDVLNAVFYNSWLELEEKWNYHNYFVIKRNSKLELINLDKPIIIHYTGPIKPWEPEATSVLKGKYLEYERIYLGEKDERSNSRSSKNLKVKDSFKIKLFEKLKSNFLVKKIYNFMNRSKFFRDRYHKVRVEAIYSDKLMEVYKAKKIEMKDSLFESNMNIYLGRFSEYEKYIEVEGFVFKENFSDRKTKKYIVFFSKNREKKYFFELGTVDREICNKIYFDGNDYSSSGFFSFVKKDELLKGEYEAGLLIKKEGYQTYFKKINREIVI